MPITREEISAVNSGSALRLAKENNKLLKMLIRAVVSGDDSELIKHCKDEADEKHKRKLISDNTLKVEMEMRKELGLPIFPWDN
ncbi:MAG: hypothetical protein GY804_11755 [Alphaproteobacteria bacterium]|nr:hypothetical protein [Alphaproteobacteria bacterium]